ncbi:MAG: DEAD/DEAH box helicase [Desulfuromonadaceae bacterium]|nr:DEAD/DEAH box helicase [Desulfuromonadaceae bacterium]MDD5104548.1 DEAD/DEAH box helicase [Desulfuromonadaceae bacterium]
MTIQQPATPSPLLQKFAIARPGDIHSVAAKTHLLHGFNACRANNLKNAVWNVDKSVLEVTFVDTCKATLMADGWRILTTCTCREWQPARNCPHVVIAWATVKRVVSPETLSHITFNTQMLLDMKEYLNQEPGVRRTPENVRIPVQTESDTPAVQPNTAKYRLLIEQSAYGNSLKGSVRRGNEQVYGWSAHGLPTGLARFLASHYFYESTERYFRAFTQMTGGAYPIVFRSADERETVLTYIGESLCNAGITFDIQGNEVSVSRTYFDGTPLPVGAIVHGQLLFDQAAGTVVPVAERDAWKQWETVFEALDGAHDRIEDDFDDFDDDFDDEADKPREAFGQRLTNMELRREGNSVIAPLQLFNTAGIRMQSEMVNNPTSFCHFLRSGIVQRVEKTATQSYLLDIPEGFVGATSILRPVSMYGEETFPFSQCAFWLFDPAQRTKQSAPMRTKKRVRAVIEAAFQLLDESKASARAAIIRSVTASPDFSKRAVKREGKQLLTLLAEAWQASLIVALAAEKGWSFVQEDRRRQAKLLKIVYNLCGLEVFTGSSTPGEIAISTPTLLKILPQLTEQLQDAGFSLRIGNAQLSTAAWEFSLDATQSSQDWFELKPEIRCNGELLTEAELRGLMDGSAMLHRDGKLMLLDEISARILAMFAGAVADGKKKKKGEQELVRVPRLQILDWLQLRSHGVTVALSVADARILESLLNFSAIPARPLPTGLRATLRHYQIDAWHWLAFLYEHRFGACLADDMGLGKTVQGITLLAGILSGELKTAVAPGTPHLVVAPPSLLFNWEAELSRFLPGARVMIYSGSGRSSSEFATHDVIITSYGIVQRDCDLLAECLFDVIIYDETQVVKNLQAATTNAVRKLQGAFTLALTGTPVENHLGEYFAIMDLCLPGLLGRREEFSRKLSADGPAGTARLIGRTRPFVLRRTKELIAAELPPKIEMDIPLELTTRQRMFYQCTVEEVRGQVQEAYESHAPAQARVIALTAILRLRQICLAPALASAGASETSPKLEFLAEQLAELRDEGHSALVFSQFTGYLNLIESGLKGKGFTCLRLDGSTPVPQRKKLVQVFQDATEPIVFLISLKAGGKGLNLTRATYVYHMDPWWNPAVENQASDRAHRIGQTEQVTITRLIMKHTIEEKMMALKEQKTQLYRAILMNGTGGGGAGLTREDFDFLLG